jgi:hypothetical protein
MGKEQLTQQYKEIVRQHLDRLTNRMVAELQPIIHAKHDPDTYLLDFEVHLDGFVDGFPVVWDPMDRDLTQLAGRTELLSDIPFTIPKEVIESETYEAADVNTWDIAFGLLVAWFAECWKKAGGLGCPYPAYICRHDDIESFDLKRLKWVSDSEKWLSEGPH